MDAVSAAQRQKATAAGRVTNQLQRQMNLKKALVPPPSLIRPLLCPAHHLFKPLREPSLELDFRLEAKELRAPYDTGYVQKNNRGLPGDLEGPALDSLHVLDSRDGRVEVEALFAFRGGHGDRAYPDIHPCGVYEPEGESRHAGGVYGEFVGKGLGAQGQGG